GSVVELILSKHGGTEDPEREPKHNATLPMTSWIGAVERFGFSLALLLGLPTVAAILIGVKALGAYTATDNKIPAKRVLGTLVSVSRAPLICRVAALGYPEAVGIAG